MEDSNFIVFSSRDTNFDKFQNVNELKMILITFLITSDRFFKQVSKQVSKYIYRAPLITSESEALTSESEALEMKQSRRKGQMICK